MTKELFESLLYEEEGTTIDFKKEQYRFVKASDEEKSELLKDILGFANAWRRSNTYILIGVEEVRGGKSHVIGIDASDHLDDHSLQQFVNNLVNTPVRFQYRAFTYEGKHVGIFVIDDGQQRPIHLKKNYGKLKKDEVYVRYGSSTEPRPATPSEIAQMGKDKPRDRAELLVEFAEVDRDDAIGVRVHIKCELCSVPERKAIPKLRDPHEHPLGIRTDYLRQHNTNYYHELAEYEFMTRLCRPVRLTVKNVGVVAANNVRVELVVPKDLGLLPTDDMPEKPAKEEMAGARAIRGIRSVHRRDPGEVDIDRNDDRYRIEIDCKDLQPGRRIWSDRFYIGVGQSGDYPLQGHVFADNLPTPQHFTLTVTAEVAHTTLTVEELCSK
ncbi:MAG: ATP-binding protein [Acidobacteria bacterium]|nr:ATP-binding protein [Acidobacteriota bacterium]